MANERMKWNSTPGFIGTSENLTFLNSAPMYSRKTAELVVVVAADRRRRMREWKMKVEINVLHDAPEELVFKLALRYILLYETITKSKFEIPLTKLYVIDFYQAAFLASLC
ncbi:phosphoribosylaminoimidazole-succinocarboxamidesynthase [Striga asiatica]|uniref:Phosphoribosylaminoimidazole-succinocarboxamidesynthase n=1 Tax=Striga asiatica TaxID=4170 RepID=A0A5A7RCZ5_STRAF|nr:phosphoribosylaminoimidazole-succinocarboxamidesynthase [Striga asiatica]